MAKLKQLRWILLSFLDVFIMLITYCKNVLLIALSFFIWVNPFSKAQTVSPERLKQVAEHGRHVMPFDLKLTQHLFSKTEIGGIQRVIAKNPKDTLQIALIRQHLTAISGQFKRGDFSNPAKIHGGDMPGLVQLSNAKQGQLHVIYKEIVDGAEIAYTSEQPALIDAVHRWFDAQLADHGTDAAPDQLQHSRHALHHRHSQ